MEAENIKYMLTSLLILTSFIILIIIVIVYTHIQANRKKSRVNVLHNMENEKGVSLHLKENKANEDSGVVIHLNKKEQKKMWNFSLSSFALFIANLTKNNTVVNWDLSWKDNLYSIYDFFFWIQKYINKLLLDWHLSIKKEDLFKLHKDIGRLDLNLLKKSIQKIAEDNDLIDRWSKEGELLFRKIVLWSISNDNYLLYMKDIEEKFKKKMENIKKILEKKNLNNKDLTTEEVNDLKKYEVEKEIQKEINNVLWNKANLFLIEFDKEGRELHIWTDYKNLLRKELQKLVVYYKKKKNLKNIIFYI